MGPFLYMVYNGYVLVSILGAHTRGRWENPWRFLEVPELQADAAGPSNLSSASFV